MFRRIPCFPQSEILSGEGRNATAYHVKFESSCVNIITQPGASATGRGARARIDVVLYRAPNSRSFAMPVLPLIAVDEAHVVGRSTAVYDDAIVEPVHFQLRE